MQLRCAGFSLQWLLLLWSSSSRVWGHLELQHVGSVIEAPGLQSTGSGVVVQLCGAWDLPTSGIEPVFSALADGFFTTEPPRKPKPLPLNSVFLSCFMVSLFYVFLLHVLRIRWCIKKYGCQTQKNQYVIFIIFTCILV